EDDRRRAPSHPARGPPRGAWPHRHKARVRAGRMRDVHGARRWGPGALLPDASGVPRRRRRAHRRRSRGGRGPGGRGPRTRGGARYADDIFLPRMLYGRLLRSTRPHARIRRIDVSRALAHPGVVAAVIGADMPEKMGIMPSTQDETALAVDKVRYVGEPVAAVAAVDEDAAFEALSLIEVDYEDLEPIFTIEDALEREDVKIHEEAKRANVFKEVH